jgi:hypothetical protein
MYLHSQESVRIYCPAYLANGGAIAYSQIGNSIIPQDTPLIFDIKVLECQGRHEDLISVGRKNFKSSNTTVLNSGLKPFKGTREYDSNGAVLRKGGGPSPDNVDTVKNLNSETGKQVKVIEKEVNKHGEEADKLHNDMEGQQKIAKTKGLDKKGVIDMVKTEGKYVEKTSLREQGKKKIDKIKATTAKTEKTVNESTDPQDEENAVDAAKKAKESSDSEADVQKKKEAPKMLPVKNEKKAAKKALGKLLASTECMRLASMTADGTVVALTAKSEDLYAPKHTGVFNVEADRLQSGVVAQRWRYDAKDKSLAPHLYPNKALSEGANKNLFVFDKLNLGMQQFLIDATNDVVLNVVSRYFVTVTAKSTEHGWNSAVQPEKPLMSLQQHWVILGCDKLPEVEEPTDGCLRHAQTGTDQDSDDCYQEDVVEDERDVKRQLRQVMA